MELSNLTTRHSLLQQLFGGARGRPLAIAILALVLLSEILHALPQPLKDLYPTWFSHTLNVIRSPAAKRPTEPVRFLPTVLTAPAQESAGHRRCHR